MSFDHDWKLWKASESESMAKGQHAEFAGCHSVSI